ncbi:hypothetical protein WA588_004989, partial [Blastocystis sp. NMH]
MDKSMEDVERSIHTLCYSGDCEAVMDLIENGTDINILDDDRRTPLHWASASKNTELVRYLLSIPTIQVNAQDESGYTPLMCAVSAGREETVSLLLAAGADVNMENENLETVIHMTRDRTPILKLVIDKIQNLDKQNDYGLTALMKCSSLGCLDSIQLLLDHHANVLLQDMEGNTAAHYAAFDNRREAYILLLHNGYDESIVNKENKTALDY